MASLLVYVDASRLRTLLADRALVAGARWSIGHAEFPEPQLDQLDEDSLLVIVSSRTDPTTQADRAFVVASLVAPQVEDGNFIGGNAIQHGLDITHLLPRLGCPTVGDLPAWCGIPRVLPPNDVDALAYTLQLELAATPPRLQIGPPDALAESLRAAVLANPGSDDVRMIYADRLQDLGDPRGELIALQLSRATSGAPATERELLLVEHLSSACAQPLTFFLNPGFALRRGFLSSCAVNELVKMPEHIVDDPAWSTVEHLDTRNFDLLTSPRLVSATRAAIDGRDLPRLAGTERTLPFETLVGPELRVRRRVSHSGIWLTDPGGWHTVMQIGALGRLRTLSVNVNMPMGRFTGRRFPRGLVAALLASPLGSRLDHLDLYVHTPHAEADSWRRTFDGSSLALLTIRFRTDETPASILTLIALHRGRPHRLVIQVDEPLALTDVTAVLRMIAPLSRGLRRIEVHDLGAPSLVADRQRALISRLAPMFSQVVTHTIASPSLAP